MRSFAWLLAAAVGFLSLSQEIIWVRIIGFAYGGAPQAFAFTLAHFLIGIALGATVGKTLCARSTDLLRSARWALAAAGVIDLLLPSAAPLYLQPFDASYPASIAFVILLTAGAKSVLFPIAHQLGSQRSGPGLGRSISRVYFANIVGSTLGPLITGYVLLDYLSVDHLLLLSGLALLLLALCSAPPGARGIWPAAGAVAVLAAVPFVLRREDTLLQRLATRESDGAITFFTSNRAGVIHAQAADHGGDIVFGGNIYDGRAAIDVDRNENRLDRLYLLGMLVDTPRRAVVVGLSTGAWTRALLGFRTLERIDVVEINPGYLQALQRYPEIRALLDDPRVVIHVDDGRRWLRRNPQARFDLIVQNTTFHWRANASNLLSVDYMREVLTHLTPAGAACINTTGSYDVLVTAATAFPHAYRYANFVYASRVALQPERRRLADLRRPDGAPFSLDAGAAPDSVAGFLRDAVLEPVQDFIARNGAKPLLITDDNLLVEYRSGHRLGPEWFSGLLPEPPPLFNLNQH